MQPLHQSREILIVLSRVAANMYVMKFLALQMAVRDIYILTQGMTPMSFVNGYCKAEDTVGQPLIDCGVKTIRIVFWPVKRAVAYAM